MKRDHIPESREEVLRAMREFLRARHGIEVIAALGFENSYALAMRRDRAESLGVRTISDLRRVARNLTLGGDYEFFGRPEWKRMKAAYDLAFRGHAAMDSSLMYDALVAGAIDLATVFSTDGRIAALNLVVLNDDRRAIPPYDAVVLVGKRLATNRRAMRALSGLERTINAARMRAMNAAVDLGGRSPHEVAVDFLRTLGSETRSEAR